MMEIKIKQHLDQGERSAWDAFVNGTPGSDVSQLSSWARVRQMAGFEPVYLMARDEGELIGGAQVLVRRLPVVGSLAYVPYGPILPADLTRRPGVCHGVGSALERLGRARMRLLFVQPPEGADDVSDELQRRGFRRSDAMVAPAASIRLDLRLDEEALRQRMNSRLRGWTTRWADRGVCVRLGTREDLPLFAELHQRSAEHQRFEPLPLIYMQTLYDALAANGNVVVFVGEVDGQAVAVDLLTCCGGVVRDRLVGLDRSSRASKLSVSGAVKWEAIRWGKANGFRWLDFGSLSVPAATALLAGEHIDPKMIDGGDWFKISFGGEPYINPPAVERASSRLLLHGYDAIRRSNRGGRALSRLRHRLRSS
jgi:lipid II:glycine glycyltransferase (peptidoglycan interpeptide bridge formation enzyme)